MSKFKSWIENVLKAEGINSHWLRFVFENYEKLNLVLFFLGSGYNTILDRIFDIRYVHYENTNH